MLVHEVATGYRWWTVPYSVLFSTTLHRHLTKGFLHHHQPARKRAPIRRSTTSVGWFLGLLSSG